MSVAITLAPSVLQATALARPIQSACDMAIAVLTCPFLPRAGTVPDGADVLKFDDTVKLLRETARQASSI